MLRTIILAFSIDLVRPFDRICTPERDLVFEFSECSIMGKRGAFYYYLPGCYTEGAIPVPEPVVNLSCSDVCKDGEYVNVDPLSRK